VADNPNGPGAKGAAGKGDDKGNPVTLEQLAANLTTFTGEITKQVQGIRQLVNQRDEFVRDSLEKLSSRGKGHDPEEEEEEESEAGDRFDELTFESERRAKKKHPLLRHVDRVAREARERDDEILQGQAVTSFLVESDEGDPTKGIAPEHRKKYLPKIEEILKDRGRAARFVHRKADGTPDYKLTLENVYNSLKLDELQEARGKAAEERKKLEAEKRRIEGAAYISGGEATEGDEVVDTSKMTSDEMIAAGLVGGNPKDPVQPLNLPK